MSRTKLKKFAEIKLSPLVFDPQKIQGKSWNKHIFKNNNPIFLEIACGKAKFSLQMAQANPEINFIGVDRKGARLWSGAKTAQKLGLTNIVFFQGNINYLEKEFTKNQIDELWITFPDPLPRTKNARQRLTHKKFLQKYQTFLKPQATLNLKTDFTPLLEFTIAQINDLNGTILQTEKDIYSRQSTLAPHLFYQTDFELQHLANQKQIHYLRFSLPPSNSIAKIGF